MSRNFNRGDLIKSAGSGNVVKLKKVLDTDPEVLNYDLELFEDFRDSPKETDLKKELYDFLIQVIKSSKSIKSKMDNGNDAGALEELDTTLRTGKSYKLSGLKPSDVVKYSLTIRTRDEAKTTQSIESFMGFDTDSPHDGEFKFNSVISKSKGTGIERTLMTKLMECEIDQPLSPRPKPVKAGLREEIGGVTSVEDFLGRGGNAATGRADADPIPEPSSILKEMTPDKVNKKAQNELLIACFYGDIDLFHRLQDKHLDSKEISYTEELFSGDLRYPPPLIQILNWTDCADTIKESHNEEQLAEVKNGKLEILKIILENIGRDIFTTNALILPDSGDYSTILIFAIAQEFYEAVPIILEHCEKHTGKEGVKKYVNLSADTKNDHNESIYYPALMAATENNLPNMIEYLLELGADLNESNYFPYSLTTMELACKEGFIDAVSVFAKHGATAPSLDKENKAINDLAVKISLLSRQITYLASKEPFDEVSKEALNKLLSDNANIAKSAINEASSGKNEALSGKSAALDPKALAILSKHLTKKESTMAEGLKTAIGEKGRIAIATKKTLVETSGKGTDQYDLLDQLIAATEAKNLREIRRLIDIKRADPSLETGRYGEVGNPVLVAINRNYLECAIELIRNSNTERPINTYGLDEEGKENALLKTEVPNDPRRSKSPTSILIKMAIMEDRADYLKTILSEFPNEKFYRTEYKAFEELSQKYPAPDRENAAFSELKKVLTLSNQLRIDATEPCDIASEWIGYMAGSYKKDRAEKTLGGVDLDLAARAINFRFFEDPDHGSEPQNALHYSKGDTPLHEYLQGKLTENTLRRAGVTESLQLGSVASPSPAGDPLSSAAEASGTSVSKKETILNL